MSEKVSMMKGMSGHGAYMLIRMSVSEPHEVEELMQAWLDANAPEPKPPEPDMFWLADDPDDVMSLQHLIDAADTEDGSVIDVLCAKSMPNRRIRAWREGDGDKQRVCWEWVDETPAKSTHP